MTLDLAIRHPLGRITLDVAFTCGDGITGLFGPSGAGKTTVLHVVAGLLRPARTRVTSMARPVIAASETAVRMICPPPSP